MALSRRSSPEETPIKIMYVIGTLDVGGAEKHLVELVTRLDRTQFEPKVCCLSEGGPLEDILRSHSIDVRVIGFRGLSVSRIGSVLRVLGEMRRYFIDERPVIVHTYLYWANIIGGIIARLTRVPILITSRRSLGYFKENKFYYQWLENWVNSWTKAITVNSRGVLEDVLQREKIDPTKIHLIYNGVDTDMFARGGDRQAVRRDLGIEPDVTVVGCIANLIPYKGHKDLIQAACIVLKEHPKVKFVFIGRNDRDYYRELNLLADQLGITNSLIYAGPRRDIVDVLSAIDILVLASHEEGFSNVVLEGMAAGKPLVITAVGGNSEAIVNGSSGILVPPKCSEVMANAIKHLITNQSYAQSLGTRARERVQEHFNVDQMVLAFEQLYIQLTLER